MSRFRISPKSFPELRRTLAAIERELRKPPVTQPVPGEFPVSDDTELVFDVDNASKRIRLDAGSIGDQQTRVLAMPDSDVDLGDATASKTGLATATQIAKLDGIEASATTDQTDAEIETAYNSQVAVVPQAEAEAGTATTRRGWTAERVKQAIAALESAGVIDHGALSGLGDDDHTQYLLADGTRALTANWDVGPFKVTAETLESDIATGTAPLVVASTTVVPNLNADKLDGSDASAFAASSHNHNASDINAGELALVRGGIGADISGVAKGGLVVGTGAGTMGLKAVGTNDQVLTADSAQAGGMKWADAAGGGGKHIVTLYLQNPAASDVFPICFSGSTNKTITKVWGVTNFGTVIFNLEARAFVTPGTTATNVLSDNMEADSNGENTTAFAANAFDADEILTFVADSITSSPGELWVFVEYE